MNVARLLGVLCSIFFVMLTVEVNACEGSPNILLSDVGTHKTILAKSRHDYLMSEATLFSAQDTATRCNVKIRFITKANGYSQQGFSIGRNGLNYSISSSSSLGHLYGFYEVLDDLGYIFSSTKQVIKPTSTLPRSLDGISTKIEPAIATRGLWSWGEKLDRQSLIWAGRNRFNLLGGRFQDNDRLRSIFGMRSWGGGHYPFWQFIIAGRDIDGTYFQERYPEWFSDRQKAKWQNSGEAGIQSTDTYIDLCYGEPELVKRFANILSKELLRGIYKDVDVLNIWPSDRASFIRQKGCRPAPNAKTDVDDLVYFYRELVGYLQKNSELISSKRHVVIAGIGYYGTYDLSKSELTLPKSDDLVEYTHFFYNNVRSYNSHLFDSNSGSNRRLMTKLLETKTRHKLSHFGAVEYYNYSIYRGMVSPHTKQIRTNITQLKKRGLNKWAYMHMGWPASPFHAALDYNLSRVLFSDENPERSLKRFASSFTGQSNASQYFDAYELAIEEIAEFIGPETSLYLVTMSDRFWATSPFDKGTKKKLLQVLLGGGKIELPPQRLPNWGSVTYEGRGLSHSLSDLNKLQAKLQNKVHLQTLYKEVRRTWLLLSMIADLAQQRLAIFNQDLDQCMKFSENYLTRTLELKDIQFPKTLSEVFDKRKTISQLLAIYENHVKDSCYFSDKK